MNSLKLFLSIFLGAGLLVPVSTSLGAASAKGSPGVTIRTHLEFLPGADRVEILAPASSLIVQARVAQLLPPRSGMGRNMLNPRAPKYLEVAWQDVVFDQITTLWKETVVPNPGRTLIVRVYNAETPEVKYEMDGEPSFVAGEKYILFLNEIDSLGGNFGPPHWHVAGGTLAAFLLNDRGDRVTRKGPMVQNKASLSKKELMDLVKIGHFNVVLMESWRRNRAVAPKGINF